MQDGKFLRWEPGTVLRYCVLRRTFPERDRHESVVENMRHATGD
ncbi:hypothetical protein [Streptomyces sp. NPDC005476]